MQENTVYWISLYEKHTNNTAYEIFFGRIVDGSFARFKQKLLKTFSFNEIIQRRLIEHG